MSEQRMTGGADTGSFLFRIIAIRENLATMPKLIKNIYAI